jgi:hypothetical protein
MMKGRERRNDAEKKNEDGQRRNVDVGRKRQEEDQTE